MEARNPEDRAAARHDWFAAQILKVTRTSHRRVRCSGNSGLVIAAQACDHGCRNLRLSYGCSVNHLMRSIRSRHSHPDVLTILDLLSVILPAHTIGPSVGGAEVWKPECQTETHNGPRRLHAFSLPTFSG